MPWRVIFKDGGADDGTLVSETDRPVDMADLHNRGLDAKIHGPDQPDQVNHRWDRAQRKYLPFTPPPTSANLLGDEMRALINDPNWNNPQRDEAFRLIMRAILRLTEW